MDLPPTELSRRRTETDGDELRTARAKSLRPGSGSGTATSPSSGRPHASRCVTRASRRCRPNAAVATFSCRGTARACCRRRPCCSGRCERGGWLDEVSPGLKGSVKALSIGNGVVGKLWGAEFYGVLPTELRPKMSARCAKVSLKTEDGARDEKTFIPLKPGAELRDFVVDVGIWAGLKPGTVRIHHALSGPCLRPSALFVDDSSSAS